MDSTDTRRRFRLLFFEPQHTGHHFAYLARMLPGFADLPIDIALATTEEALASEQYKKTLAPFESRIELLACCQARRRGSYITNAWNSLQDLSHVVQDWSPDHVAVMYADGIWQLASLSHLVGIKKFARQPVFEAWIYRGRFTYPDSNSLRYQLRWRLFGYLLSKGFFTKIHFDDEIAVDRIAKLGQTKTKVVLPANPIVLRNPVSQEAARAQLGLPLDGHIISCSGQIAAFKGAPLAMEAFHRFLAEDQTGAHLLFAGPHEDTVKTLMRSAPYAELIDSGRLISQDRFLSEHEMLLVAEASDLVIAPYPNHSGRSSIILWAAAAGRPVLGVNSGCIRYVIETQGLGETCDVTDPQAFADALSNGLSMPWSEEDAQRVRSYAKWHRIENYQRWSSELVRDRVSAWEKVDP